MTVVGLLLLLILLSSLDKATNTPYTKTYKIFVEILFVSLRLSSLIISYILFSLSWYLDSILQYSYSLLYIIHSMDITYTHKILNRVCALIQDYFDTTGTGKRKVVNFKQPDELQQVFDFSLTSNSISSDPIALIHDILDLSVNTQHGRFWNQLYAGPSIRNIIGEWLTSILNTSMATYEIAPLFTLMEKELFSLIAGLLQRNRHQWFMVPWGSIANLYGMHFARHQYDTSHKTHGLQWQKYVIFTSDQWHYSLEKNAALIGIGTKNIIKICSDQYGHMDVINLEYQIQKSKKQWHIPLMINATFGTTIYGALDPINSIADIAEKYNIWLHVDGALGWSLLMSHTSHHSQSGLHRMDSLTRNPHKMLGSSQQASIFITRHQDIARTCNSIYAGYLFGQETWYDRSLDTGDTYLQCGRKPDILKLRLQRKIEWLDTIAQYVDNALNRAQLLSELICMSDHLLLVTKPETTNVCFRFLPPDMDPKTTSRQDVIDRGEEINWLTTHIKKRMLQDGFMMCSCMTNQGLPNFWRMITHNIHSTDDDMRSAVAYIQRIGIWVYNDYQYDHTQHS